MARETTIKCDACKGVILGQAAWLSFGMDSADLCGGCYAKIRAILNLPAPRDPTLCLAVSQPGPLGQSNVSVSSTVAGSYRKQFVGGLSL